MTHKKAIAVFIPKWLYENDVGITMFVRGLYRSIRKSGEYRLLKLSPRSCSFRSLDQAKAFVVKHNIALVIYHDTRGVLWNSKKERGLDYLEACVPFLNPKSVHVADDKLETKRLLRQAGIPVLLEVTIRSKAELLDAMTEGELYVAKPHDAGVRQRGKTNQEN